MKTIFLDTSVVTDKKKYYKLDEIGIIGTQDGKSAASNQYHARKTGEVFRKSRAVSSLPVAAYKIKNTS